MSSYGKCWSCLLLTNIVAVFNASAVLGLTIKKYETRYILSSTTGTLVEETKDLIACATYCSGTESCLGYSMQENGCVIYTNLDSADFTHEGTENRKKILSSFVDKIFECPDNTLRIDNISEIILTVSGNGQFEKSFGGRHIGLKFVHEIKKGCRDLSERDFYDADDMFNPDENHDRNSNCIFDLTDYDQDESGKPTSRQRIRIKDGQDIPGWFKVYLYYTKESLPLHHYDHNFQFNLVEGGNNTRTVNMTIPKYHRIEGSIRISALVGCFSYDNRRFHCDLGDGKFRKHKVEPKYCRDKYRYSP